MLSPFEFKKRRDFGQIINDTFAFIRQNFKPLITTYAIFCGLFVLASMATMLLQQYKMVNILNDIKISGGSNRNPLGATFGIEYFLSLLFSLFSYASMSVSIHSYIAIYINKGNQAPTIDEVWGYFKHYFFRVFGSSLALLLLLCVAFIFCVAPFFWLFPFVSMIYPIMVIENGSLAFSFNRSFQLIKDNFWVTFGTLIIVWIIVYACMTMVVLPTSLMNMVGLLSHKSPQMSLTLTMITTVLQSLCQVFFIIPIITVTLVYFSLVEQKENLGLMERITQFGDTEKPTDTRPEEY